VPGGIEAVGQHVSSLVHELNNSLAIISLQTRLLSQDGTGQVQVEASLDVIREQARRMSQMVDDLRSLADPHQPRLRATNVNAVIRYALDIQRPQLQMDGIELVLDLSDDLPLIQADPYQLQQVFINFVNNARHAMLEADGGGTLTVVTQLVRAEGHGEPCVRVEFSDTGPGIPEEVMPHLFESYYTTRKATGGTGLGLAICERLAQKHRGRIRAENNAGGGATFVLELPVDRGLAPPDEEARPEQVPAAGLSGEPESRILIIDDDLAIVQALSELLREQGFQITATHNAGQALTLLAKAPVDLIISDLSMPQVDGRQFWRALMEQHPQLTGRVLYFTGDSSSRDARAFLTNSGCNWLEKPVQAEELVRSVRETLGRESQTGPGAG